MQQSPQCTLVGKVSLLDEAMVLKDFFFFLFFFFLGNLWRSWPTIFIGIPMATPPTHGRMSKYGGKTNQGGRAGKYSTSQGDNVLYCCVVISSAFYQMVLSKNPWTSTHGRAFTREACFLCLPRGAHLFSFLSP